MIRDQGEEKKNIIKNKHVSCCNICFDSFFEKKGREKKNDEKKKNF